MILIVTCLAATELVMEFISNSMGFHLMPNLNTYWVPCHFCGFLKMKWYHDVISFHFYQMKWNDGCQTSIIIHITCISLSLCRNSAPIYLTSVLGVLGTQETSCTLIEGLLERDSFDLFLTEFDKPWVIHLRETCCYSTNLCTWRPNTFYKNRRVHRHQALFWRHCRGGKVKGTHILWLLSLLVASECSELFSLDSAIISFCFLFLFSLVRLNGK
jgi:hypothetical protein